MNAYEEIHQDLVETIAELIEANRTTPVIVEGERDVRSLRALGLEGEVIPLNAGVPLFNLAESLSRRHTRAIILTDWDHRGGHLARLLRDALEANQVRFDTRTSRASRASSSGCPARSRAGGTGRRRSDSTRSERATPCRTGGPDGSSRSGRRERSERRLSGPRTAGEALNRPRARCVAGKRSLRVRRNPSCHRILVSRL